MNLRAPALEAPPYAPQRNGTVCKIGLAVESMRRHMTDEGWQIFDGLQYAGYDLWGWALPPRESTLVPSILSIAKPSVVVVQDKREWDVKPNDFRERRACFHNIGALKDRHDIFKVTILKDAHQRPMYHRESADEMGCHAWIVYYYPDKVKEVSGFVRREHLIRTYHTLDPALVPAYSIERRNGCLLSGAISDAYPLRMRLHKNVQLLPQTSLLEHPGYHRHGTMTPKFLSFLTTFKVAICTASMFGYALRKIIEATAAGCVVITDLPENDALPEIDGNLCRIPSGSTISFVADTIKRLIAEYNPERQAYFAECAKMYYDYKEECKRLSEKIDTLSRTYTSPSNYRGQ